MLKTIITCPQCDQKLRVPEDRGSILVTCGSCELQWKHSPETPPPEQSSSESSGGLKSWLGQTARSLTGNVADVTITGVKEGGGDYPAMVDVRVHTANNPVEMKALNLQVLCEETVTLPSSLVRTKLGLTDADEMRNHRRNSGKFDHCETTYEGALEIHGPMNLDAKSTRTYSSPIQLPDTALPTFEGRCIANQWRVRAVLETSSGLVNPKSDWVMLPVSS